MNYSILKDWELSREVFYAANPDTDLRYNSVSSELLGSVTVQNFNGEESEIFSINCFEDIMPLIFDSGIWYRFYRGDDYNRSKYKAAYSDVNGCDNFTTIDNSLFRALAICFLKMNEAIA